MCYFSLWIDIDDQIYFLNQIRSHMRYYQSNLIILLILLITFQCQKSLEINDIEDPPAEVEETIKARIETQ